jgi:hypothetical protein
MFPPHIPGLERFILNLRNNRPFMRISDILVLSLVALSALGCAGEWGRSVQGTLLEGVCIKYTRDCYWGAPFTMAEFVSEFGAPVSIFMLPVIDVLAALLMLFKPSRTYLGILVLSFTSLAVFILSSSPTPSVDYQTGSGQTLTTFATFFNCFLAMPLALAEQLELYPQQKTFWESVFH